MICKLQISFVQLFYFFSTLDNLVARILFLIYFIYFDLRKHIFTLLFISFQLHIFSTKVLRVR